MTYRLVILSILAATLFAVSLTACGGDEAPPGEEAAPGQDTAPAEMQRVILSTGIGPEFADLVVAVEKGFFEKYGIEAELKPNVDGNVALDALLSGDADIGGSTEGGGIVRRGAGGDIYVVGAGATSGRSLGILVRGDISQPEDLLGKKIGYTPASGGHYFLERYFRFHGLDLDEVQHVQAAAPELLAAINRGDIDAWPIWDPWRSRALEEVPNTKVIAWNGDNNVYIGTQYWYFSQRMVDDKELGTNAVRALIDAQKFVRDNPEEAAELVADAYELETAAVLKLINVFTWGNVRLDEEIRERIKGAGEFAVRAGLIESVPDLDAYIRPELLEAAQRAE
jgi:ABC-type nitrate/sulfonate/bicarbonate transport system substrate-binding protein